VLPVITLTFDYMLLLITALAIQAEQSVCVNNDL